MHECEVKVEFNAESPVRAVYAKTRPATQLRCDSQVLSAEEQRVRATVVQRRHCDAYATACCFVPFLHHVLRIALVETVMGDPELGIRNYRSTGSGTSRDTRTRRRSFLNAAVEDFAFYIQQRPVGILLATYLFCLVAEVSFRGSSSEPGSVLCSSTCSVTKCALSENDARVDLCILPRHRQKTRCDNVIFFSLSIFAKRFDRFCLRFAGTDWISRHLFLARLNSGVEVSVVGIKWN